VRTCKQHRFTLAEALAALVVAAVLIPVVTHAVLTANRASRVAHRSETAARLADAALQRLVTTGDWENSDPQGDFDEHPGFRWELTVEDWPEDDEQTTALTVLRMDVLFVVQNEQLSVGVTTLIEGNREE